MGIEYGKNKLERAYKHAGIRSLTIATKEHGIDAMVDTIMKGVRENTVADLSDLKKCREEKSNGGKNRLSFPEVLTGVALLECNLSYCWDYLRIFPDLSSNSNKTIYPDFVTNLLFENKIVTLEYHSLNLIYRLNKKKYRNISIQNEANQWEAGTFNNGLYVIFGSDFTQNRLSEEFNVDVRRFSDVYISPNSFPYILTRNEGVVRINHEDTTHEKNKISIKKSFEELKMEIREDRKNFLYYDVLVHILRDLEAKPGIRKLGKEEFLERIEGYTRKQIEINLLTNPYCNELRK